MREFILMKNEIPGTSQMFKMHKFNFKIGINATSAKKLNYYFVVFRLNSLFLMNGFLYFLILRNYRSNKI